MALAGRTREIGLRMALGAPLSDVQKLFGLALALTGAPAEGFLYGVSACEPITFTARRASRVDPMIALRTD